MKKKLQLQVLCECVCIHLMCYCKKCLTTDPDIHSCDPQSSSTSRDVGCTDSSSIKEGEYDPNLSTTYTSAGGNDGLEIPG